MNMKQLFKLLLPTACRTGSRRMSSYNILFPGQGSQYVGMTEQMQVHAGTKDIFQKALSVLGYDLWELCLKGPQAELDKTVHCQPAVVIGSLVALKQLERESPEIISGCQATAGFSVGEITALIFAEALTLEQGLQLIKVRAEGMQEACLLTDGSMVTLLNIEVQTVEELCLQANTTHSPDPHVCVANYIFPRGVVISGTTRGVQFVQDKAKDLGAVTKPVAVSGAFHSQLMSSAVPKLIAYLDSIDIRLPRIPVYSNVTSRPYSSVQELKHCLSDQVTKPVLWEASIRNMLADGRGKTPSFEFAEVGPGKQLKTMLKRIDLPSFNSCHSVTV